LFCTRLPSHDAVDSALEDVAYSSTYILESCWPMLVVLAVCVSRSMAYLQSIWTAGGSRWGSKQAKKPCRQTLVNPPVSHMNASLYLRVTSFVPKLVCPLSAVIDAVLRTPFASMTTTIDFASPTWQQ